MFQKLASLFMFAFTAVLFLGTEPAAQASAAEFQHSYINATARCQPQYGQATTIHLVSDVYTFCPYGPQLDVVADSEYAVQQAAQSMCPLGKVTMFSTLHFPYSTRQAADSAHFSTCLQGCTTIAWTGAFYGTNNNPANCHP